MKTRILFAFVLLIPFFSTAQTNGWYQYYKATHISNIDVDASGNIHLATDSGYIMYNTTTNMVEDYANLTSQNPPIGWCSSAKVNPTNNNVALGFSSGQGIAIYDGTNYTIYHSENSDLVNFTTPQFHYTDSGLLYIFDTTDTKYQTFENGTFNPVQNISFRPQAIIENMAGTKAYFAGRTSSGLADGLYELNKTTNTFTKYTTSNSGIVHNGVNCFYRDTNDLLYIGGYRGVSTLDATGNWTVYQEPLPINPSVFYDVFSIDKFSDGAFLVNNSNPNSSEHRGFSTVDFTTNSWTHYDNTTFCNNADRVGNITIANNRVYAQFISFGGISRGRLWFFNTSNNACKEQNINHLNVVDLDLYGTSGLAIRQSPNNANNLETLWTSNRELKSMDLPTSFSGGFPNANTILTSSKQLNDVSVVSIDNNANLFVGDDDGVWIIDETNTATHLPHEIEDFRLVNTEIVPDGSETPNISAIFGGWKNNTDYENYKTKINLPNNAKAGSIDKTKTRLSSIELVTPDKLNHNPLGVGITNVSCITGSNNTICTIARLVESGIRRIANHTWNTQDNNEATLDYDVNISTLASSLPDLFYADFDGDGKKNLHFRTGSTIHRVIYDPSTEMFTFEPLSVDINSDGKKDEVIKPKFNDAGHLLRLFAISADESNGTRKKYYESGLSTDTASSKHIQTELTAEIIPGATIENLPKDFYVLNLFIYIYNNTHYASILSTTYGLLINTAIDYSSLTLSNDETVLNNRDFVMYPNPADDKISFLDETINKIEVFNLNGRKIVEIKSNNISVAPLNTGIYIIKATNINNQIISKKLIKN